MQDVGLSVPQVKLDTCGYIASSGLIMATVSGCTAGAYAAGLNGAKNV